MFEQRSDPWIVNSRMNRLARLRLFCFPPAGCGASVFHGWSENLPAEIDVCPVQLPGRENRLMEPPFTSVSLLVRSLTKWLRPYLDIPFVIFGHSMGALIGFELARHLRRKGQPGPSLLFVSSCRAPQRSIPNSRLHSLPDHMFLQALGGMPSEIRQNDEAMRLMLPTLRADFFLCETYTYVSEVPLSCSISAIGGVQDSTVGRNDLADWSVQTKGTFKLLMLPGGHFYWRNNQTPLLTAMFSDLARFLN